VKRLVRDSFRDGNRLKRGGGTKVLPLDSAPEASTHHNDSPDEHFDRQWATALIDRTLVDLEADYSAQGKSALFAELRKFIVKDRTEVQEAAANRLGMNIGTFRMNLSRLRSRFGELFRQQVAATIPLGNRCDVDEEIAYLMGLFEASSNGWSP
jgi:RNA polymerase sigma-70 factor (ECF subfamily)